MTKLKTNPAEKISEAKQWCIEARKLLKLSFTEINEFDLKSRATDIFKSLEKLRSTMDPTLFAQREQEFIDIAQRINEQAKVNNKNQVALEAERLNVLSKTLLLDAVRGNKEKTEKAQKSLVKANESLASCKLAMKGEYEKLLRASQQQLNDLRTVKYAEVAAVNDCIEEAKKLVATPGTEDWPGAVDLLVTVAGLVKEANATAEKWQKEDIRQSAAVDHYTSKQLKLSEVIEELQVSPGVETYVETAKKAVAAGKKAIEKNPKVHPFESPLYQDGYDAIVKIVPSTEKLLQAGLSASKKANQLLQSDKEILSAEKNTRAALAKLCKSGDELIGSDQELEYNNVISKKLLLCAAPGKKIFGIQNLETLTEELNQLFLDLSAQKSRAIELKNKVQKAISDLLYDPTDEERVALRLPLQQFQNANSLLASLEFTDAEKTLDGLHTSLSQLVTASPRTPDKFRQQWEGFAAKGGLLSKAQENIALLIELDATAKRELPSMKIDEKYFQLTSERWKSTLVTISNYATKNLEYSLAVNELQKFSTALENLVEQQREFNKSISGLEPILSNTEKAREKAENSLKSLSEKLKSEPRPQGSTVEDLTAEFKTVNDQWQEALGKLSPSLATTAESLGTKFTNFADKCAKIESDPQTLTDALAEGVQAADRKAFDKVSGEVEASVNILQQLSNAEAVKHASTATGLKKSAETGPLAGPGGAIEKMTSLKLEVSQAITAKQQERSQANVAAQQRFSDVKKELSSLKTSAKSQLGSTKTSIFTPLFEALEQDLLDIVSMLNSLSLRTVQDSIQELDLLSKRIARLVGEIKNQPSESRQEVAKSLLGLDGDFDASNELGIDFLFSKASELTPDLRLVLEAISLIEQGLKDRVLRECMPVHQAMLSEDFGKIKKQAYGMEPAEAFDLLRNFQVRLSDAQARSILANDRRQEFNKVKLPLVEKKFEEISKYPPNTLKGKLLKWKTEPKAYFLELENRISAAKSLISEPQKESTALSNLAKIDADLQALINTDATINTESLVTEEKAAQERALQKEKEKKLWAAKVKNFKNMPLARAEEAVKSATGGDASQIKDLNRMLKQAEDIFAKTDNYIGAVELLNNAIQYAARVQKNPQGLKTAARDELPKVLQHWKRGVASFNSSVDTMIKAIDSADDDDISGSLFDDDEEQASARRRIQEAVAKSIDLISGLKQLFNANIMDAPIAVLTSKKTTERDKRAAREQALKYVRDYGDLLRQDPILLRLLQSDRPFGTVDFYGLNAALRDLDLNIQRSV